MGHQNRPPAGDDDLDLESWPEQEGDREMWATLRRVAAAQGMTVQEAGVAALREYLDRPLPPLPGEDGPAPPASLSPARTRPCRYAASPGAGNGPPAGRGHPGRGTPSPLPHAPA